MNKILEKLKDFYLHHHFSIALLFLGAVGITAILVVFSYNLASFQIYEDLITGDWPKQDDWRYDGGESVMDKVGNAVGLGSGGANFGAPMATQKMTESANLGLSVGGAKDVNNFRDNIENDYLPLTTDITYEGLFYDYYFDTGQTEECEDLFCPSYTTAVSPDPFSGEDDYYLSVGLNSGLKKEDFARKKLNLVVVLDISGSMSSSFNKYYYDRFGNKQELEEEVAGKSKMEIATESINSLLDHLKEGDRFGMVLFDNSAHLAKPLNLVERTNMNAIKDHISEIVPRGGTRMSAGMEKGTELFEDLGKSDPEEYENRIIFLTDAMPNLGNTSEEGLLGMTRGNAQDKIYSSFVGIGVDFNTELVEAITKIRGANYYSVHSPEQFKERMDTQFEYMVTPLVFDLNLTLEAEGYEIKKVYGSPEADEATGEIMKVNTLFPSETKEGKTKGGLVLLKLERKSDNPELKLKVSYEDRAGKKYQNETEVAWQKEEQFYDNTGIRKGIVLSRYADLIKNWIRDERVSEAENQPVEPSIEPREGIIIPPPFPPQLGEWERQSIPLEVSSDYQELFAEFQEYLETEQESLSEDNLEQEAEILDKLIEL